MSSSLLEAPAAPVPGSGRNPEVEVRRTGPVRVLHSEWLKLTTLRSTWVGALVVLAAIVGFGALAAAISSGDVARPGAPASSGSSDPVSVVMAGANFAVLIVAVIGGLVGAREFGTGMIRTTLAAVPRRLPVLWAKLVAFLGIYVPLVVGGVVVAFTVGMRVLHASGAATVSWSDAGVARAVLGSGVEIVGLGVLAVALGVLLRNTAAAIGTVLGAVIFLPALASALLPDSWDAVLKYLPSNAASAFTAVSPGSSVLNPGTGFIVFALWVAAAVAAAAVALRSRDV